MVSGNKNYDRISHWLCGWHLSKCCFACCDICIFGLGVVESMIDVIGIYSEGWGSGKDSIANVLAFDFDYVVFGFSEVMKDHLYYKLTRARFSSLNTWLEYCEAHKYDKVGDEGFWVRTLLKGYGQFYRSIVINYWVDKWEQEVSNREYEKVAVPNVRFPNEAFRIKQLGGKLIKVIRPGIVVDNDPSEISMKDWIPDCIIYNDGTLLELGERVRAFMQNEKELCLTVNQSVKEKLPES